MTERVWWLGGMLGVTVYLAVGVLPAPEPALNLEAAERRECPHTWYWNRGRSDDPQKDTVGPLLMVPGGRLTLAPGRTRLIGPDMIQDIPEFHDCQRFIVQGERGALRYDSLFAIFASHNLSRLREYDTAHTAITAAFPAAEIVAWNNYSPLRIRTGFNCLYLYKQAGSWRARLVSSGLVEAGCNEPVPVAQLGGVELQTHARRLVGVESAVAYPAVARWDTDISDPNNPLQYIGVACGSAWCEIGAPGFRPSQSYLSLHSTPDALPPGLRRVYGIKGWHDQQVLAVRVTDAGGQSRTVPTRIVGTIIPDTMLATATDTTQYRNRWKRVAWVALAVPAGESNPYTAKMNLDPTTPGSRLNVVSLCYSSNNNCIPATELGSLTCGYSGPDPDWGGRWWARIVNTSGKRTYKCVQRYSMVGSAIPIPATVRWRWLASDETTWDACPMGCCEMH